MGTATIDLDIYGTRIGVVCEDADGADKLRRALAAHLVDEPAPTGFVLKVPARAGKFHVLLDHSGWVLGRTRSLDGCLAILGSHLTALAPPPPGTSRLRMRALVGDAGAVLAGFPLFTTPPAIERRLERSAHRIIDRLAVDVTSDLELQMSPTPWPELADDTQPAGHAEAPAGRTAIRSTIVPRIMQAPPTEAALVALYATALPSSPMNEAIELAERLAAVPWVAVDPSDGQGTHDALRG